MRDMTCLADGLVVNTDLNITGVNANELIIGGTGSGKTKSNGESRLLHTNNSSVVITLSKSSIVDKYSKMFKERGYNVEILDFTNPDHSTVGYDPMKYMRDECEVNDKSRKIVGAVDNRNANIDPYWPESAGQCLASFTHLVRLNSRYTGKEYNYMDVLNLIKNLEFNYTNGMCHTNMDTLFDKADNKYPNNPATNEFRVIRDLSSKTASCIASVLFSSLSNTFNEFTEKIITHKRSIDFRKLGEEKTALFIITPAMSKSVQPFINLMYADLFKELFELGESNEDKKLKVPVHLIADDFAVGGRIPEFDEYISVFRAIGISVTLLLQSEFQLEKMYGQSAAQTIIMNCDTMVFMGGNDPVTCKRISERTNKPVHTIYQMKPGDVIVFRRGYAPLYARRYQIFEDELYKKYILEDVDLEKKENLKEIA